jgi:hypothetical protein
VAAAACIGALVVMIVQILRQPHHTRSIWTIAVVMALPFVYEIGYSKVVIRFIRFRKAER